MLYIMENQNSKSVFSVPSYKGTIREQPLTTEKPTVETIKQKMIFQLLNRKLILIYTLEFIKK